jgi:hypothetical protein
MALPLDYFAVDFQSNRNIPRCRRLLPYYWQRSLCQAVKAAVREVARAGVGGGMWQLLTHATMSYKIVWRRATADEDGYYCFAVAL